MRGMCPGQDSQFWKPDYIYNVPCKHCGRPIEFFRDDLRRKCRHCGKFTVNPKNDMGCAAWCAYAEECLAQMGRTLPKPSPHDEQDNPDKQ